jgi:uncharacterized membrane protein
MVGVLSGLALAESVLPYFPLSHPASFAQALGRTIVGHAGFVVSFLGIRVVEKSCSNSTIRRIVRFLRFGYIPVYILIVAPTIFKRVKL